MRHTRQSVRSLKELDEQFNSLIALVDTWLKRSPAKGNGPDAERIRLLLMDFKTFFGDYYGYFQNRIASGDFAGSRNAQDVLSNVVRRFLEQGATVTRMLQQRRYGSLYRNHLLEADNKAAEYYGRYHGAKLEGLASQPIAYFEKIYHITRFHFRPPPLIAIPLADWNQRGSWLPLAHELGHHVFWNSSDLTLYRKVQMDFKRIVEGVVDDYSNGLTGNQLGRAKEHWLSWLEETFADIFGTLTAGPIYALSAQDRLVRTGLSRAVELLTDDAEHPLPAVRPLIASETLKQMMVDSHLAVALEKRWSPYLNRAQEYYELDLQQQPEVIVNSPSPIDLASMVPAIVSAMLSEPVLQTSQNYENQKPIQELVDIWAPDSDELDIARFTKEIETEPLPEPPPLSAIELPPPASRISEDIFEPDNAFGQLVSFIREEIVESTEERPEWEVLLSMDLARTSGAADHWDYQSHTHWVRHRHNYYNSVIAG